jgi:hypothetical protein
MTSRAWQLPAVLAVLGLAYVFFFTDWLHPTPIGILPEVRATPPRRGGPISGVYPVSFALDDRYALTDLKVVKVGATNVLWHLVPGTNTVPTKAIIYGRPVPGMKSADGRKRADPLEADVDYELQIKAGRRKGRAVFHTKEMIPAPTE